MSQEKSLESVLRTASIIERMRDDPKDIAAREQFALRYGKRFFGFCRARGLGEEDARDVTQEVFVKVFRSVPRFDRNLCREASSWLFTIAAHAVSDWCKRASRRERTGCSDILKYLASLDGQNEVKEEFFDEQRQARVDAAEDQVRKRCRGEFTWACYDLVFKQGFSRVEAAEQLGIESSKVRQYVLRVIGMMHEAYADLVMKEEGFSPSTTECNDQF